LGNCTPVFVDIHPEYLTDETKIEAAITDKTSNTGDSCPWNPLQG
jgi:dTDP-4-amino-4,6-dideoxygalactose transaminase